MTDSQPHMATKDATGGAAGTGVGSEANKAAGESLTITIPAPCQYINSNMRLHRMAQAKLTKIWRQASAVAAQDIGPLTPPVHITAHIWKPRAGRYDPNNLAPTTKAIVDGLVDAGLLADDSVDFVIGPDHRHGGKGPAAVIITISQEVPDGIAR